MASTSVNVRLPATLAEHVRSKSGPDGQYDNSSEFIRDLIRRDIRGDEQAWRWLERQLSDGAFADEDAFSSASADDVIQRNKARLPGKL